MRYKERWMAQVDGVDRQVYPSYDRSLLKEGKDASGWFGSKTLDVTLTFQDSDFRWLKSLPIYKEITLYLQTSKDEGQNWITETTQTMTRFDMKVNESEASIEAKPETLDRLRDLLDGMQKEYDILELSPELEQIKYRKRPLLQIYIAGLSTLSNFLGASYYETALDDVIIDDGLLQGTYKFGRVSDILFFQGDSSVLTVDISGAYFPEPGFEFVPDPVVWYSQDGKWELRQQFVSGPGNGYRWRVFDLINGGAIVYTSPFQSTRHFPYDSLGGFDGPLFTSVSNPSEQIRCFGGRVYGRLLSNKDTISGTPLETLPVDDIIDGLSYAYSYPITTDIISATNDHSLTPSTTRFGKFHPDSLFFAGQYFLRQTGANAPYYPLMQSRWTEVSWWIHYTPTLIDLQENGSTDHYTEALTFDSAINTLLNSASSGQVVFSDGSSYSDFYFNASNPVKGDSRRMFIIPINNIIIGDYSQPQKKVFTRLSELMMIPTVFHNASWFIEDDKLRFEHVRYLRNGKSYTGANIGVDYTDSKEPKTGLDWGHGQRIFDYRKDNIPSRMEWKFLGDGSKVFKGEAIDILEPYVNKGNVENYVLENFTADIDFVNTQGTSFSSPNSFVIVECEFTGGEWVVPFITIEIESGEEYLVQNGYLAMAYLHPRYWKEDAPGTNLRINRSEVTAISVRRNKHQTVILPMNRSLDAMKLVRMVDGDAWIGEVQTNITEVTQTYELFYDNE